MENHWHTKSPAEIFKTLSVSEHGLSQEEAARRLKESGANKLPDAKVDSLAIIFLRQFQSPLIYILLAAGVFVFAIGEIIDGLVILAVLIFNAIAGTFQEGKAQNTLLALRKFVETRATVIRGGKELIISDSEVVPGDIIIVREGTKIPGDARIIDSHNLKVDESALTGESQPIHKISETLHNQSLTIAEQKNMLFKGMPIVSGNGKAIIVATGLATVIGKISKEIASIDTEIPLKTNIRYLSRLIIATVAVICAALFFIGISFGKPVSEMAVVVVSLAVSIIPEGLPIVVTLILATGVWRMSKRNALVKKLQAVEALGQARVIAVDKTGTITKNELTIQQVYVGEKFFKIEGVGYEPKGEVLFEEKSIDPLNHPELLLAGKIAAFCSNAHVMFEEKSQEWRISGDPTEAAMLVLAQRIGFNKNDLERENPEMSEIPFDYKLKYHATVHRLEGGENFLTVVGAPEQVMALSNLSPLEKEELESIFIKMSRNGMRVLALATNPDTLAPLVPEEIKNLNFIGFFGMRDTLRPEVHEAMEKAVEAGIRVVMITGDHKVTAEAIAKEAGIFHQGDHVLTGEDIDMLTDKELSEKLPTTSVFARVTPEHKIRIIQAYRHTGEIVAMTGDGVNDAPSLVAADLGVAMGKIGTEVAKEAADIVLLDDNFGSIISAIEEGRSIYKTIKKVILYLFSTSFGEVLTISGGLLLGLPLPLLATQIIWLNFVTDGFLTIALAMDPKEKNLLRENFERPKKYLVDRLMAWRMFLMAIPMMVGTLYLFREYIGADMAKAWTMSLTTLAIFQWFNAWNCRSDNRSVFASNPFSNIYLVWATVIVTLLQLFAVYNPLAQKVLHTTPLALSEWLAILPIAASIIFVEEIRKLFSRNSRFAR